jgi:hypothetical protein
MILLFLLTGRQEADPNAEIYEALGYLPTFESAGCQFDAPSGYKAECGYLTVPEDGSQPEGPQIRLHLAIFKSTSPNPEPDLPPQFPPATERLHPQARVDAGQPFGYNGSAA